MSAEPTSTDRRNGPALPRPDGCAVVTMELQRGVVGDLASMPALAEVLADRGTLDAVRRVLDAARGVDVPVVHARVEWRADRRGTSLNTPLVAALARNEAQMLEGTGAVEPIPDLGDVRGELVSTRAHGLTPFTGTDLDAVLRTLGVRTVIAVGVSLNVGVLGLCLSAGDLGYRVVVPTDAVAGVPASYGDDVLRNSIAMVATLCSSTELAEAWSDGV